ncbi:hypothetical protein CDL12_06020 [Handroanthus impetiginosus]|uniref:Uncharacterized protein n=1 Tax=Handroanthus impetiginosus TaxID=429701 RepID=A0A2G9HUU4_9LAMI|nr:hypothetical protein CDL12_06020 [Handroanthus impetiginosus]
MASNNSYETSWADQWDPQPLYTSLSHTNSHTSSSNISGKFADKTKEAASTGVKKVKAGATAGIHWIKHKYHKTTQK